MAIGAMAIAAIIAGLASAGAGIYGAASNYQATKETNQANIDMQNATNQIAMNMANTSHQREMSDLKAAGLNPVLTATGGNGAPVASISSPKAQAPQIDTSGVSSAINSTLQSIINLKMAEMIGDNYKNLNDQKLLADAPLKGQKAAYYRELVKKLQKHNSSEINSVISSPVPQKYGRKSKYQKKLEKMSWQELLAELD